MINNPDNIIVSRAKLLENIVLFKAIDKPDLLELASLMKQSNVKKNTVIINQGDLSRILFVLVYGQLKIP